MHPSCKIAGRPAWTPGRAQISRTQARAAGSALSSRGLPLRSRETLKFDSRSAIYFPHACTCHRMQYRQSTSASADQEYLYVGAQERTLTRIYMGHAKLQIRYGETLSTIIPTLYIQNLSNPLGSLLKKAGCAPSSAASSGTLLCPFANASGTPSSDSAMMTAVSACAPIPSASTMGAGSTQMRSQSSRPMSFIASHASGQGGRRRHQSL